MHSRLKSLTMCSSNDGDGSDKQLEFQYIFLVYVGRSGSTFLARQIAERTNDVLVFAETKLVDNLLAISEEKFQSMGLESRVSLIKQDPRWHNLGIDENTINRLCSGSVSRVALFNNICRAKLNGRNDPKYILVKNGASVFNSSQIAAFFNKEVLFLHISRDPRGSTCSRMRKAPVYKERAGVRMEDPWFLARFWLRYHEQVKNIKENGVKVIETRYENLITAPEETLSNLFDVLGIKQEPVSSDSIMLSDKEMEEKHKNVLSPALSDRLHAWQDELPWQSGVTIEAICSDHIEKMFFTRELSPHLKYSVLLKMYFKHVWYSAIRIKEKVAGSNRRIIRK